jgi:Flp pilus assembly protein TadD
LEGIGIAFQEKGQLDKAIALHREAIRLSKNNYNAHNNVGIALEEKGRLDEAIASYREAIRLDKDAPSAHNNIGVAFARKGRLDQAIAAFREAVRLRNHDATLHSNLGNALLESGQLDDAIAAYRDSARLGNHDPILDGNLGEALLARGRLDEAIASFREAVRGNNGNAEARINLGNALHASGQIDEAVACYREAIRRYQQPTRLDRDSDADAHRVMAWFLATCPEPKFRDVPRAVELAKKAVALAPSEHRTWSTLGAARYRAGNWKAAVEALEKSRDLRQGGDSFDWFFRAMAHWQMGQKGHARGWYDQAVQWMDKTQPQNAELRRFRAEAEELLGIKATRAK